MKLRSPILTETDPSAGNELQRQVAARITARHEAEQRKKRRMEWMKRLKAIAGLVFFLVVVGCGWHLWRQGTFDEFLPASMTSARPVSNAPESLPVGGDPMESEAAPATQTEEKGERTTANDRDRLVDQYGEFTKAFMNAAPVYWKDAPDVDRPAKAGHALTFKCVVPDKDGEPVFMEVRMSPQGRMTMRRLTVSAGFVEMPKTDFDALTAKSPYLVGREGRVYFATPNGWSRNFKPVPVTASFKSYNPSKQEFGQLYDLIEKAGMSKPAFKYDVFFDMKGKRNAAKIATVAYGDEVSREQISKKLAEQYSLDADDANFMASVMASGSVRFSRAR